MPSQAELDAQNNASRARQQARRGIEQSAPQRQQPQVQQPYVNPYGGQYGTDSIQDQGYYDNYYDDEEMTEEEWAAYLAGLEESQGSQEEPSYYSDYGSRMPDGPIEAPYQEEIPVIPRGGLRTRGTGGDQSQIALDRTGGAGGTQEPGIYGTFMDTIFPSEEQKAANLASGSRTSGIQVLPEPEAETPFLQYIQDNTQQPQGGGAKWKMEQGSAGSPQNNYYNFVQGGGQMNDEQLRQANEMAMSMGTTFNPNTGYSRTPIDTYGGGSGRTPSGEMQAWYGGLEGGVDEPLQRSEYQEEGFNNPDDPDRDPDLMSQAELSQYIDEDSRDNWNTPMTGMRPIDPETGQPVSQRLIDAAARAGVELPMASVPMPREPQVQAPMSVRDTQAMLQERFGSPTVSGNMNPPMNGLETDAQGRMIPTVYDQADRNFYDNESMLRDQRIENRPDFNEVTRDIDKYDNRRTFAEARRLVPTKRDKYGNITNKDQQRAAMTLTEREVQDKQRDEYNEEYRAKNLERIQQTIDNGNKTGASKLEKKKGEVAEEILLVQETYENYQPWMGQAIEADRMNIVPAPSGFKDHLDFAAYQNSFNLDELYGVYETINQGNNGKGGAAPVRPRPPAPSNSQPRAGDVIEGHRFNGGDPSKKENWTKV